MRRTQWFAARFALGPPAGFCLGMALPTGFEPVYLP
jgi:hypothetical protein